METNILGFFDCSNLILQDTVYGACNLSNSLHLANIFAIGLTILVPVIALLIYLYIMSSNVQIANNKGSESNV